MPVLPNLQSSQSVFSDQPLASQSIPNATPDAFGGITAAAAGQLAQGAHQASAQLTDVAVRQQAIQNETDANNQFYKSYFPQLTSLTQSYLKLGGKDAIDQLPVYQQKMEDLRDQMRGQLQNPLAQRMFDDVSRRLNMFQMDGMQRHALQQNQLYEDQTSQGMVDASGSLALQHWNDPNAFESGLQSGAQEIRAHSMYRGEPVEYANAKVRDFTSKLYAQRLQMMAQSDPVGAWNTFQNGEDFTDLAGNKQHVDIQAQIGPAQLPSVRDYLLKGAKEVWARDLGQSSVTAGGPAISATNQSRGVRNNNFGNLKDASGNFQQFDTPEQGIAAADANLAAYGSKHGINTLAGVINRWAPASDGNNDAAYIASVSKATGIGANDPINLGDKAVRAKILPAMFDVESPGWRNAQSSPAGPTTSTADLEAALPAKVQAARDAAKSMFPNDPAFADKAASYAEHAGNTILAGTRATQAQAAETITKALVGNGDGSGRVTSMDQILSDPTLKAAWSNLKPESQLALTTRLSRENAPLTQQGLNTYYRLRGESLSDPEAFAKEDLSGQYGAMPDHLVLDLINRQTSVSKADAAKQSRDLNWTRTEGEVDDMLKPMGLGKSAKAGSDESKTTAQFYGRLEEQIDNYHQQNQKYPDTATTRKMAAGLLVQGQQAGSGWFGMSSGMMAFQSPDLSKFSVPVPDDQKPAVVASLTKALGHAPTDEEAQQWWTRYQLSKGKK
jgi:soluble lytic murein transglycosylase